MIKLMYANGNNSDAFYLTKARVPDNFYYLQIESRGYIFLDSREYGVFKEHNQNSNLELVLLNPLLEEAQALVGAEPVAHKLAKIIVQKYSLLNQEIEVPNHLPLDLADYLRNLGIKLKVSSNFCPSRVFKTEAEKECIKSALVRTQEAYKFIEQTLKEAVVNGDALIFKEQVLTSEFLKQEVEKIFLNNNLWSTEGMIIAGGVQAAIPHHHGSGVIKPSETIICDLYPQDKTTGYFADMTRTYFKGEPKAEVKKMYEAVLEAQTLALAAIKPGVKLRDIHLICVETFKKLGYETTADTGFIHNTGHGLGLQIHEEPYFRLSSDTVLEAGQVVTVEPGLYHPVLGGVRIEDVVYVTSNGSENLTNYPKDLVIF